MNKLVLMVAAVSFFASCLVSVFFLLMINSEETCFSIAEGGCFTISLLYLTILTAISVVLFCLMLFVSARLANNYGDVYAKIEATIPILERIFSGQPRLRLLIFTGTMLWLAPYLSVLPYRDFNEADLYALLGLYPFYYTFMSCLAFLSIVVFSAHKRIDGSKP